MYNEITDHPFNPAYRAAKHSQGTVDTTIDCLKSDSWGRAEIAAELLAPTIALGVVVGVIPKIGIFPRSGGGGFIQFGWRQTSKNNRSGKNFSSRRICKHHGRLKSK